MNDKIPQEDKHADCETETLIINPTWNREREPSFRCFGDYTFATHADAISYLYYNAITQYEFKIKIVKMPSEYMKRLKFVFRRILLVASSLQLLLGICKILLTILLWNKYVGAEFRDARPYWSSLINPSLGIGIPLLASSLILTKIVQKPDSIAIISITILISLIIVIVDTVSIRQCENYVNYVF